MCVLNFEKEEKNFETKKLSRRFEKFNEQRTISSQHEEKKGVTSTSER